MSRSAEKDGMQNGIKWVDIRERKPGTYISVLGYLPQMEPLPVVRECFRVHNDERFYVPALNELHWVTMWAEMPKGPN